MKVKLCISILATTMIVASVQASSRDGKMPGLGNDGGSKKSAAPKPSAPGTPLPPHMKNLAGMSTPEVQKNATKNLDGTPTTNAIVGAQRTAAMLAERDKARNAVAAEAAAKKVEKDNRDLVDQVGQLALGAKAQQQENVKLQSQIQELLGKLEVATSSTSSQAEKLEALRAALGAREAQAVAQEAEIESLKLQVAKGEEKALRLQETYDNAMEENTALTQETKIRLEEAEAKYADNQSELASAKARIVAEQQKGLERVQQALSEYSGADQERRALKSRVVVLESEVDASRKLLAEIRAQMPAVTQASSAGAAASSSSGQKSSSPVKDEFDLE